jgi:hypothetical protein
MYSHEYYIKFIDDEDCYDNPNKERYKGSHTRLVGTVSFESEFYL